MNKIYLIGIVLFVFACQRPHTTEEASVAVSSEQFSLTVAQAGQLASLPLKCIQQPFPYKSGLVIANENDLQLPKVHHPAFYGCFDWHSAVHGHWVLVYLLKRFPDLSQAEEIREKLNTNLTEENIQQEIAYFTLNNGTANFERTYGWAWLLKLSEELEDWEDTDGKKWKQNLRPLADLMVEKYMDYLPKLSYPIRVGEHTNTAFGLTFAWDYAEKMEIDSLKQMIAKRAGEFYANDQACPINWEPSGYDFLSPCLEEAEIMQRVLKPTEFQLWFKQFLPAFAQQASNFEPAIVSDRSDGKMVHLDGLNFSRAWCLYRISNTSEEFEHLREIADQHLDYSLPNMVDGNYAGEHWLASFALYALSQKEGN